MKEKYGVRLAKVEKYLQSILPENADMDWKRKFIGDFSSETSPGKIDSAFVDRINMPALDLISRGGKRWRPLLMMLFYELYKNDERIVPLTLLTELPHNGTLIVDDIEDSSDFRRGKPAVHLIYGSDSAINSGNFLYFLPLKLIDTSSFPDRIKLAAYAYYSEAMRRLHIGQGLDIEWHNDCDYIPSEDEYIAMCSFKTGGLSLLAGRLGVAAGGGSEEEALKMGLACEAMGVGFQIIDDVTDLLFGNPGKKRGDDIVEGKKSLPVILFEKRGGNVERLKEIFRCAAEEGIEKSGTVIEEAVLMIEKSGALEESEKRAFDILNGSREKILSNYRSCEALDLISYMFDSFMKPLKKRMGPNEKSSQ